MAKIDILVGSTLGNAEYVADELCNQLKNQDHQVIIHGSPSLDQLDLSALWLIVSSTHGAGDLPDNIQPFLAQLMQNSPDLSSVKLALCAIGDSSYDTFCQGPEKLYQYLLSLGATSFVDKIQIDVQVTPEVEDPALAWLSSWQDQL